MKLSECRETYYTLSGTASAVTRQAAFAGIALIWIFNSETPEEISLPTALLWPALFFIICLAFDLLQYVVGSAIWAIFHRIHEKKPEIHEESDIEVPCEINWPANVFFWGKNMFVLVGYGSLLSYVGHVINFK